MSFLNCKAQDTTLYVGTYTNGDSQGIYKLTFNTKTGALTNKQLAAVSENPSFIAFSPNKKYIYAVGEGQTSAVTAFKVTENKTLEFINSKNSNGKGPCHVSTNENDNKVVVSNYGGGTVSIYTTKNDGSLNEASQVFDNSIDSTLSELVIN